MLFHRLQILFLFYDLRYGIGTKINNWNLARRRKVKKERKLTKILSRRKSNTIKENVNLATFLWKELRVIFLLRNFCKEVDSERTKKKEKKERKKKYKTALEFTLYWEILEKARLFLFLPPFWSRIALNHNTPIVKFFDQIDGLLSLFSITLVEKDWRNLK